MITTIKQFINESHISNIGYHVGNLKYKTDYIGDKLFHIKNNNYLTNSKTGHFGAGFYFFGNLKDAEDYQKIAKRNIIKVDFSKYNLYKPNEPEEFVESVIALTDYLTNLDLSDLTQQFVEELHQDLLYFNINIDITSLQQILQQYLTDLNQQTNPKSDYIITRILKNVGYQGIDLRGTKYDNFYLGSVLFDIIPTSILNSIQESKTFTNDVFLNDMVDANKVIPNDYDNLPHKIIKVNIDKIYPTQKFIYQDNLSKVKNISKNTKAELLYLDGKYYVIDGHHRIATRILQGDSYILADVYNYNI